MGASAQRFSWLIAVRNQKSYPLYG